MSKKKIDRSGCLPYYVTKNGEIKILFMKPSNAKFGGDEYQMAKGKREEGETAEEAGYREAREEIGLFSGNVEFMHHLGKFLGRTDVYVCRIKDKKMFGDPSTPDEVASVKWLTPEEFQQKGRGLHKPVVKAAVRWIKEKEGLK